MVVLAMVLPLLPGTTAEWRRAMAELAGPAAPSTRRPAGARA